jgi:glycosyltransferase involved in cell wall biosynthesis
VRDGGTGFLLKQPEDADVLAKELKVALSCDESERRRMGEAARTAVEGLTWERHVGQWEELLGNLP